MRCGRRKCSCGCSPTTFPVRSPTSTACPPTRSSTRRSRTGSACRRTRSTAARRSRCWRPTSRRFCGPSSSARTGASMSNTSGSTASPTAGNAGCTAGSRRTSTPTAGCAVSTAPSTTSTTSSGPSRRWRRARSSSGCSPTTFRTRSSTSIRERRYVFVNDAFLQLNGLDRATVIGKTAADVIGLEATKGLTPYQDRAFAGETVIYERALVDATGRSRWIRGRMVPDHRIDGAIQGIYVVLHDITDLKSAQDTLAARESQLRAVMDGVPAPVAYIDRTERCQYVNRALLQYFGFAAEAGGDAAACRRHRSARLRRRAGEDRPGARRRVGRIRPADPGGQRRLPLDDDPRRPRRGAFRRRARRVRPDERHPRPEAGAGGAARVGIRAAPHHGQRARARGVHRSRLPLPVPESAQRGVARPQAATSSPAARWPTSSARSASRRCGRCSSACCWARPSRSSSCWRSPPGTSAGSPCTTRRIAMPKAWSSASTRCTRTCTTRSATKTH